MNRYFTALLFLGLVSLTSSKAADAEASFKQYLNDCTVNEIRCLYFLDDRPEVGMVMTLDLQAQNVYTAREVFNWATQNAETRKLSYPQAVTLKKLSAGLQSSDAKLSFNKSLFVAIHRDDGVHIYQYERQKIPSVIQRIYDLGGGAL